MAEGLVIARVVYSKAVLIHLCFAFESKKRNIDFLNGIDAENM